MHQKNKLQDTSSANPCLTGEVARKATAVATTATTVVEVVGGRGSFGDFELRLSLTSVFLFRLWLKHFVRWSLIAKGLAIRRRVSERKEY